MTSARRIALVWLLFVSACSNGSGGGPDASTDSSGGNDSGKDVNAADTGPADAASDSLINIIGVDPVCTLPAEAGTGACVTLGGDITCNPVTGSPCNGDAGEACDIAPDGGFQCFAPPPPNSGTLCGTCDDQTTACAQSSTCVTVDGGGGECARYCCTDAECGTGHCDTAALNVAPVGICVK